MTRLELAEALEKADPSDDLLFSALVCEAMRILALDERGVAELFTMSVPGVRRWVTARTAPHPAMRPPVFKKLAAIARNGVV